MRCVMVVVLPVPAPARMATGPRTASAACRCSAFSRDRIGSVCAHGWTVAAGWDNQLPDILAAAHFRCFSLSPWTLPHTCSRPSGENPFQTWPRAVDRKPMALVEDRPPADLMGRVPLHYAALFGDLARRARTDRRRCRRPHRRPRWADAAALCGARMLDLRRRAAAGQRGPGGRRGHRRQHAAVERHPPHPRRRSDRPAADRPRRRSAPPQPRGPHAGGAGESPGRRRTRLCTPPADGGPGSVGQPYRGEPLRWAA